MSPASVRQPLSPTTARMSPSDRAREIQLLAEGAMVMILIHGDQSYADTAAAATKRLLGRGRTARLFASATTSPPEMMNSVRVQRPLWVNCSH
jgi:hypothetical protein